MEYEKRPQTYFAERFTHLNDIPKIAGFIERSNSGWDAQVKEVESRTFVTLAIGGKSYEMRVGDFVVRVGDGVEILSPRQFDERYMPFRGQPMTYPKSEFLRTLPKTEWVTSSDPRAEQSSSPSRTMQSIAELAGPRASNYSDQISDAIRKTAKDSRGY